MNYFERPFDKLSKRIKERAKSLIKRFGAYLKHLLFPLYLFPIKLVTYSVYYIIKFFIKFVVTLVRTIIDAIVFPFRSFKNLLKSLFFIGATVYMVASVFVIADYLSKEYGYAWWSKFFCASGTREKLQNSVVRIVGGYSEGSGFFIAPNQILTNFHVIADEPSPKIIFPDGRFLTPERIVGDKDVDLAVLFIKSEYSGMVFPLPDVVRVSSGEQEPVWSAGYPWGTDLSGRVTILKGNLIEVRKPKWSRVGYIQTNINLVEGMSGGPLVDQCGNLVGINTLGVAGLSLFISGPEAEDLVPTFTDQQIKKIQVDPSLSPAEAVKAFYVYLKARRMEDGFNLLSEEYKKKTDLIEWSNRFKDILDVDVVVSKPLEGTKDTVFIKFSTKNWVDGEAEIHYYEGTWQTVKEDGVYKMNKSKIMEVENPGWDWFYE